MINPIRQNHKSLIVFGTVVIALFLIVFSAYKMTMIKNVRCVGLTRYSEDEFLTEIGATGIFRNTYLFAFKERFFPNGKPVYIGKYDMTVTGRNSIELTVYENDAIGCVPVMGQYFLFDMDGIVLSSESEKPDKIPVVSGLKFDEIIISKKLEVQDRDIFPTILAIIKNLDKYGLMIDEIEFMKRNEIVFHTGETDILLGKREEYDSVIYALSEIIETAREKGKEIDLRNYSDINKDIIVR